jgi:hypothetical protein
MSRRRGIIAWKGTVVRRFTITAAIALMLTGRLIHAPSLVQPIQLPATP